MRYILCLSLTTCLEWLIDWLIDWLENTEFIVYRSLQCLEGYNRPESHSSTVTTDHWLAADHTSPKPTAEYGHAWRKRVYVAATTLQTLQFTII